MTMTESQDYLEKGIAAFKSGNIEAAVILLEEATIAHPDNFSAFMYLGAAYVGTERNNAAIGAFKKAEEIKPEDARAHYNLGQAYEAAGVPREAFFEYAAALRIDPFYTQARSAYADLKARISAQYGNGMQIAA
jgi:Flp pilus assembly protein TadD